MGQVASQDEVTEHNVKVSVILPTYNEREAIVSLVEEILETGRSACLDLEVLVVDDDSPDGTGVVVRSAFAHDPSVRVEVRGGERGLAGALWRGIVLSHGDTIVLMDSDGNHNPARIPLMVRLAQEFDLVVGSRYVTGGGMRTSRFRFWGSYAFNLLARSLLGLWINDNLSGYLAFKKDLLRDCPSERIFYGYGDYALRLIYWLTRSGHSLLEVPVVYEFRRGGESKTRFLAYLKTYVASVLRLRFLGLR
jgi:dolichol-phosphate mannosyltransferase